MPVDHQRSDQVDNARVGLNGSGDYRQPVMSAGVPVACPMAQSETVYSGHPRTRQMVAELQIPWSAEHDKPVPELMVQRPVTRHRSFSGWPSPYSNPPEGHFSSE